MIEKVELGSACTEEDRASLQKIANELTRKYPCQHPDAWDAFYPCDMCEKAEECTGRTSGREWKKGFTQDRFGARIVTEPMEWSEPGE